MVVLEEVAQQLTVLLDQAEAEILPQQFPLKGMMEGLVQAQLFTIGQRAAVEAQELLVVMEHQRSQETEELVHKTT
jgi:hypothetical protein